MVKVYKTKFLLLLTMLLAVCQVKASETVIYTGATATGNWSGYAQISADAFTSAKVGDIVKVYTSNVEEGAQGSFKDGSTWGAIADGLEYFEISGDFTMDINEEILAKLKAGGLIVGGQKYTIESVAIVTADTSTTETEIYAGPTATGNWSGYAQISADAFTSAKVGDIVKVYTSNVEEGAQGSFKDGSTWGAIADGLEYFEISGDFTMDINEEILAKLKAGGLIVGGQKYTIEKVTLSSAAATTVTETVLSDEVLVVKSDWSAWLNVTSDALKTAKVGDIIVVYISDVADGAQAAIRDSNWGNLDETTEYFNISGDSYTYTITENAIAKLASGTIWIGGHDYTITSVVLQTPAAGETENEIYAGPFQIISWNSIQLGAALFANCTTANTIKVYISNVADGAQGSLKTMSDGWPEIAPGTDYFNISGDSFTLPIDDDVLAKLKATGLVVSGHDYTIESVVIISPASDKETNSDLFPIANDEDVQVIDATFDAATKTINFSQYGIAGWAWTPYYDMSMYESITIELEEKTTTSITVQISYGYKASAEYEEMAAGKKKIEFALNADYADHVESVCLYPTNAEATSITIKSIYGTLKPGMTDGIEENLTADTEASVASRTYFNMAGQESSQMHRGLNIIRIQMSDGTIKVKKVIVK